MTYIMLKAVEVCIGVAGGSSIKPRTVPRRASHHVSHHRRAPASHLRHSPRDRRLHRGLPSLLLALRWHLRLRQVQGSLPSSKDSIYPAIVRRKYLLECLIRSYHANICTFTKLKAVFSQFIS